MTPRVWIERPIESVEDAEALPEGAVLVQNGWLPLLVWSDDEGRRYGEYAAMLTAYDVIGWTALVPVEAVEERERPFAPRKQAGRRRLCTAWEDL